MTNAFDTYVTFTALKQHFTTSYDYFKYNGKIKANKSNFEQNKTKFLFEKLSKKKDYIGLIVSNFVNRTPKLWVTDLLDSQSEEIYFKWKAKMESLAYTFKSDLEAMKDDFDSNIKFDADQVNYPHIFSLYFQKKITLETIVILNDLCNFFPYLNKKLVDPYWHEIYIMCEKYKPFLKYDRVKFKKMVIDRFT